MNPAGNRVLPEPLKKSEKIKQNREKLRNLVNIERILKN
jgi:hypothetical protein